MSSLQESVDARRAARPVELACATAGTGPTLTLHPWQDRSWVLPWSYLVAASLAESDDHDTLELSFTGYAVIVTGHNLRRLQEDLAGFRLSCVRALPAEYRSRLPADAPFILGIEVCPSAEKRESP